MEYYDTCGLYIESKTDIAAKIAALDAVLLVMQSSLLRAAAGEDVQEYQLNDSQTIIKVVSRGVEGILKSMQALRIIRQDYINQINGRVYHARDAQNFRKQYGGI